MAKQKSDRWYPAPVYVYNDDEYCALTNALSGYVTNVEQTQGPGAEEELKIARRLMERLYVAVHGKET